MNIRVTHKLSKSEIYPCTVRDIKDSKLAGIDSLYVGFGSWRKFRFDPADRHQYRNIPDIEGQIIAHATVVGSSIKLGKNYYKYSEFYMPTDCSLYLYQIRSTEYPERALSDFREKILPSLYSWMHEELNKRDTERLVDSQLLVEWYKYKHRVHTLNPK